MATIKKIGNDCEKEALKLIHDKGYWCHLFAYNTNGQPCDIIALKDNEVLLIDVKHCCEDRFSYSNIQPNQLSCFSYALSKTKSAICGFLIYFEKYNSWKFLNYKMIENNEKSIRYDDGRFLNENNN